MFNQDAKGKIIVVRPGLLSAVVSACLQAVTKRELVYIFSTPFSQKRLGKIWASMFDARRISFEDCEDIDSGYFYGDKHNTAGATTNWLCRDNFLLRFSPLYPGVADTDIKLKSMVRSYVDQECHELTYLLGYLSGMDNERDPLLVGPLNQVQSHYIKESGFPITTVRLPEFAAPGNFITKLYQTVRFRFPKTRPQLNRSEPDTNVSKSISLPGLVEPSSQSDAKILYFPHKTVSYGGLFYKDQFYSENRDSVFHPSNLLHVETHPIKPGSVSSSLWDYYRKHNIKYCNLPQPGISTRFTILVKCFLLLVRKLNTRDFFDSRSRRIWVIQFRMLWQFLQYKNRLDAFPHAKIALIGYEVLFPKLLSLALESREIRTVASQERFHISVIYNNWNYFLDTYFCSSSSIAAILHDSKYKWIKNLIPVGFVRTDLLYNYQKKLKKTDLVPGSRGFSNLVVIFDSPVFTDYDAARLMYVSNWRCNLAFYRDILNLASIFQDSLFVIRCKDINWIDHPKFVDIVNKLENTSNIEFSREYSLPNIQYKLAAVADLVIAKHSSIGDECLASGIPMIFHDYTELQKAATYSRYNYDEVPIFVYDFQSLVKKTESTLRHGHYLTGAQRKKIAELVNNRFADGMVRNRIQDGLEEIVKSM